MRRNSILVEREEGHAKLRALEQLRGETPAWHQDTDRKLAVRGKELTGAGAGGSDYRRGWELCCLVSVGMEDESFEQACDTICTM